MNTPTKTANPADTPLPPLDELEPPRDCAKVASSGGARGVDDQSGLHDESAQFEYWANR